MTIAGFWHRLRKGTQHLLFRREWSDSVSSDWPEWIMSAAVTDRYHAKQGRSTGRWVLNRHRNPLVVYLKRHHRLPWWQRLGAALWPRRGWSPALAEWRHLQWARGQGIVVPDSLAAGEFIGPWFQLESFLVIKELAGMLPLHEAIPFAVERLPPASFARWKHDIVEEAAGIARTLHHAGRYHKDFYLCHFFVRETHSQLAEAPSGLALIDLHRLAHHPWTGRHWQVKDLAQLLYSSAVAGVSNRDRLRFLHAYLRKRKLDAAGRRLLQDVAKKADHYRRHNAKHLPARLAQEVRAA